MLNDTVCSVVKLETHRSFFLIENLLFLPLLLSVINRECQSGNNGMRNTSKIACESDENK